ncbi:MAG TPA: LuxR C-terminal-related transcriptional regulator [Nitrospirales bacterium]
MPTTETFSEARSVVATRVGSGFLMLSSSIQLLHWDHQAQELCRRISGISGGSRAHILPLCVQDFAREIVTLMEIRSNPKDWEQFQLRQVIKSEQDSIFLSGIGLPELGGLDDSRVLIILEQIAPRQNFTLEKVKERFHFTDRETEVIEHLLKGWTNKEIANAIDISQLTVKEHIKHIMDKTRTSTRTGILVQILQGCAPPSQ